MIVGFPELVTMVAAASAATVAYSAWPRSPHPARRPQPGRVPAPAVPEEGLSVGVLGPVVVRRDGTAVALTPRMLELTAYLAAHPAGVTEDQLRCALWPDRSVTSAGLRNLLWQTRSRLGVVHGLAVLPPVGPDRRYRLHLDTVCDLHGLEHVGADLAGASAALAAVRGRPFDAARGFEWAYREGLVGWAEQRIAEAAHRIAATCLERRDPAGALAAAERGLVGIPGDETLFRDRMVAHASAGNPAGVERVMAELLAFLETDDPTDVLHPDTLAVYRRHGRGTALRAR